MHHPKNEQVYELVMVLEMKLKNFAMYRCICYLEIKRVIIIIGYGIDSESMARKLHIKKNSDRTNGNEIVLNFCISEIRGGCWH
ncbi:hypothetical protein JCM17380_35850 [Desulfosporosinus burensis]